MTQPQPKIRYFNTDIKKYTQKREFISMTKVVLTYEDGTSEEMLRSKYDEVVREVACESN